MGHGRREVRKMEPNRNKKKGAYCPPPCEECGAVVGLENPGCKGCQRRMRARAHSRKYYRRRKRREGLEGVPVRKYNTLTQILPAQEAARRVGRRTCTQVQHTHAAGWYRRDKRCKARRRLHRAGYRRFRSCRVLAVTGGQDSTEEQDGWCFGWRQGAPG